MLSDAAYPAFVLNHSDDIGYVGNCPASFTGAPLCLDLCGRCVCGPLPGKKPRCLTVRSPAYTGVRSPGCSGVTLVVHSRGEDRGRKIGPDKEVKFMGRLDRESEDNCPSNGYHSSRRPTGQCLYILLCSDSRDIFALWATLQILTLRVTAVRVPAPELPVSRRSLRVSRTGHL